MAVRPARFEDAAFVWALSQHPSVAPFRVNDAPFSWEDHLRWWRRSFSRDRWVIATDDDRPVGYGRVSDGEVSIAVDPNYRRRGHGIAIVKALNGTRAGILPDNAASIALFRSLGYKYEGDEMRNGRTFGVYSKRP